jgi:hypothetical protein
MGNVITGGWRYYAWRYGWAVRHYLYLPWDYLREVYYYFAGRPKANISRVGTIEATPGGGWHIAGWMFNAGGCRAGIEVSVTGKLYVAGYGLKELRDIAARARTTE